MKRESPIEEFRQRLTKQIQKLPDPFWYTLAVGAIGFGLFLFWDVRVIERTFSNLVVIYFISISTAIALLSAYGSRVYAVWHKIKDELDAFAVVFPRRVWEDAVASRELSRLLGDLHHRLRQLYPEAPETRVATFLAEFGKEAERIYREHESDLVRHEALKLAFENLSKKYRIPVVLNIRKAETYPHLGGAFWLFDIHRLDADEVGLLKQIKESMRVWGAKREA